MDSISIYSVAGQEQGKLPLEVKLEKREINPKAFSIAIRVLLQNWRQGTVACKGRGDVAFSNKKPWRQKGTGRARAGTRRSPLWRSGGVTFGPQARVRTLKMTGQQSTGVFNSLFFNALENKSIYCLDASFGETAPSAKTAYSALKGLGLDNKKVLLFVPATDGVTFMSFRNIPNVNILFFDQPNAFDLSDAKAWVFLKRDAESFKNMVLQWN